MSSLVPDLEYYYNKVRKEILPLFPSHAKRLLDVGCGVGRTAAYLKQRGLCEQAEGIELCEAAANLANKELDVVIVGNVETDDLSLEPGFDVILCLDILEHLVDPWETVKKLHTLLKPGGKIIASIPNVRHLKVVLPLIFKNQWRYEDEGILDKTHLRFFVKYTALELMECSGLHVDKIITTGFERKSVKIINAVTLFLFKSFFVRQYIIRASRID